MPLPPGPTRVLPKLFYSLIPLQGTPVLGAEWEKGSLGAHLEPTITTCYVQAGAQGKSPRAGSEGYNPECLWRRSIEQSLVWGIKAMVP